MRRFAGPFPPKPPSAFDSPNNGELSVPIGAAGFTLLNRFRAYALKVS
jgi:hypothetical protein